MKRSAYLIVNPTAGGFNERKLNQSLEVLRTGFSKIEVIYTKRKGDAEEKARNLSEQGSPLLIVVGGDGTFNEVVNGIRPGTPIGFIPAGTTNVLAKELRIPEDFRTSAKRIIKGKTRELNLGMINNRYFVLMAGIGFDGYTVYSLNEKIKKISGKGAYIASGVATFFKNPLKRIELIIDGTTYNCYSAIVCNASCYGGRFRVCPEASLSGETLEVCLFLRGNRLDLLRYTIGVVLGRHTGYRDVILKSAEHITISGNPHVQIDGDYYGKGPAEVRLLRRALKMVF